MKVLFVNHKKTNCGVYEFGKGTAEVLRHSKAFLFRYIESNSFEEFFGEYKKSPPDVVIYNHHPSTMPWVSEKNSFRIFKNTKIRAIQIAIVHEVYQSYADRLTNEVFDYFIAPDPTLILRNPIVSKVGRLIPNIKEGEKHTSKVLHIGSFGFATNGKGFEKLASTVANEFDECVLSINIAFAKFGDEDGERAKETASKIRDIINNPKIEVNITHDFFDDQGLVKFLSANDINAFFYDDQKERGISSVVDWAIASQRPLALTRSSMFRHLFDCNPSIFIEERSIKEILLQGYHPLERKREEWSNENLLWDYELAVKKASENSLVQKSTRSRLINQFKSKVLRKQITAPKSLSPWLYSTKDYIFDGFERLPYVEVNLSEADSFNRILDNRARKVYTETERFFGQIAPELLSKKIKEANVQQSFVFDTAFRNITKKSDTRILSVGAFEDTAAVALKKLGFDIVEVDPVLNYDIGEFRARPSTKDDFYDIVISTSVIEHVQDDEQFIKDIAALLKVGGIAVITCDFKDDYTPGDEIPDVDYRFYTRKDMERLMSQIPNCELIDEPRWDTDNYDFYYLDKYNYTFATLVFRRMSV